MLRVIYIIVVRFKGEPLKVVVKRSEKALNDYLMLISCKDIDEINISTYTLR